MSDGAPFLRRSLTLAAGTIAAQAALLAVMPVVTRTHDPAALGAWAVAASVFAVGLVAVNGRFDYAIAVAEERGEQVALARLCVGLSVLSAAGVAPATLGAHDALTDALRMGAHADVLLWLAPGLLVVGWLQVAHYLLLARKREGALAMSRSARATTTAGSWLASGALAGGAVGLVIGEIVGRVAGLGIALVGLRRGCPPATDPPVPTVLEVARKNAHWPRQLLPAALLNAAGAMAPPLVFAAAFSTAIAGWFALAARVLQLPVRLLGHALGQTLLADVTGLSDDALRTRVRTMLAVLLPLAAGLAVTGMLGGPRLFAAVFGAEWRTAGEYAAWLAPWLAVVLVVSPLGSIALARHPRGELRFQVGLASARGLALAVGVWQGDPMFAVMLYAGASVLPWLGYGGWLLRLAGTAGGSSWFRAALAAVPGAVWWVDLSGVSELVFVSGAAALSVGIPAALAIRGMREAR